jgi:hypothetical protein
MIKRQLASYQINKLRSPISFRVRIQPTWLLLWQLQLPVAATCSCTLHDIAAAAPAPRKGKARMMHGAPHLLPMAMAGMLHDGASNHAA